MFVEINEKLSAQFNTQGFALHIKVNGRIYVKNYIQGKSNLRIQLLDNFNIVQDNFFQTNAPPTLPPASAALMSRMGGSGGAGT